MQNRITAIFNTDYPIVQAGMVWCSGWRLAAAVSNSGGLGLIGAGSMTPELLREHVNKCRIATDKPFGVNIPLMNTHAESHVNEVINLNVPIVFTSAGNPELYTSKLKMHGIKVVHVVSSAKFAIKAQNAGADAVVAEGVEAGGHNGREETTTLCLIPLVKDAVHIPIIAAGGICSGAGMMAAMVLGAEGVQIGTRFAVCEESSAHEIFKQKILSANEGETALVLKKITPVRVIKNIFYDTVKMAEDNGASVDELKEILGKGRSRAGIFEGDLESGELEIGQCSASVQKILSAKDTLFEIWNEFVFIQNIIKSEWNYCNINIQ
ncbi:MAG: nitronate monooxygenase [Cytophagales bacterium]|nr:nitronate monooxygenase [Cytophagales bacterium]